jgi:lipid-A-disaccharide synthase-like uncharacterized protein
VLRKRVLRIHSRSSSINGTAVSALRRAIAEVKQRWPVIGWMTKILLSQTLPCSERHGEPFVPAAFAVVSSLGSFLLMCNP